MTSWTIALCANLALLGADGETYSQAHRQVTETGKPLVVMVGTTWCGPCQQMKRTVLPRLREQGAFDRVAFAMVDADEQAGLAQQLTGGGPVPQLVIFRHTRTGWLRRRLVGLQSVSDVEQAISTAVAETEPIEPAPTASQTVSVRSDKDT